jgi:hypothetical protein
MTRRVRHAAAWLAIAALLFAPFAASAHACPYMGDGAAMQAAAGHHGAPAEAPPPCASHCDDSAASVDLAKGEPPLAPGPAPVLRIVVLQPRAALPALPHSGDFLADPSPPLIRYTVLRI